MASKVRYLVRGFLLVLLAISTSLLFFVSLLIFNSTVRIWTAEQIIASLQSPQLTLSITELQSNSLGHWRLSSLELKQDNQTTLDIRHAELDFAPIALLKGQLLVKSLTADRVTLQPNHTPAPPKSNQQKTSSFQFPESPLRLTIKKLAVDQFTLQDPSITSGNIPRSWSINGGADLFSPFIPPTINLALTAINTPRTELSITSEIVNYHEVHIIGELTEQKNGFIGTLAKIKDTELALQFNVQLEQDENQWLINIKQIETEFQNHHIQGAGSLVWQSENSELRINEFSLLTDNNRHVIKGAITPIDLWLQSKLRALPFDLAKPWLPEINQGDLSGDLQMHWTYTQPNAWPELEANLQSHMTYAEQNTHAEWKGQLHNKILSVEAGKLSINETELDAQGQLDFFGNNSDLVFTGKNLTTDIFEQLHFTRPEYLKDLDATTPLADIKLTGPIRNPQISLSTNISGKYQRQIFALSVEVDANRNNADVQNLVVQAGDGMVSATGLLSWSSSENRLHVNFSNLTESLLNLVPQNISLKALNDLSFNINGDASITGQLFKPEIVTDLSIKGHYTSQGLLVPYLLQSKGMVKLGNLNQLNVDLDHLTLDLFDQNALTAKGTYNSDQLDFELDAHRLPSKTMAAFGWKDPNGEAEAHIRLSGNFEQPELKGNISYQNFFYSRGEKKQKVPLQFDLTFNTVEGILNLNSQYFANHKSIGHLNFQLPLAPYLKNQSKTTPLRLSAQGTMDLSISQWFLDPDLHNLQGSITTDIQLTGDSRQPLLQGTLAVTNGLYFNQATNTHWEDITLDIDAEGEILNVKEAHMRSGEQGQIDLNGKIQWQKQKRQLPSAIQLTLNAQNATVIQRRDLQGEVSGQMKLTGSFDELLLSGEIFIAPLNASIDSAIKSTIPSIKIHDITEETQNTNPVILPLLRLDLKVTAEQQAFIRGRGLDAELQGQINLQGTAKQPRYTGVFRTRRGKMELFGKRFILQSGEVRFSNDSIILLIPAVYTAEDLEVTAELYGSAEEPKLKLRSTPSLPEDEILSRLIFGKSVQEITAFQAVRLASAVNTLSSGGGFDPVDSARHLLGVDSIDIDNQETDNGSGLSVGVGKYINEKVYLQLKKTPSPTQPWQASIQIELTPRLRLETSTNENGGAGTEILWKKDY